MIFRNDVHRDIWIEHNCANCFQPDEVARRFQGAQRECPILKRALASGRKPVEWERTRSDLMAKSIKCTEFAPTPTSYRTKRTNGVDPLQDSLFPMEDLQ